MNYTKNDLETIIHKACELLRAKQPMLFLKQNNINERTVSAELKSILEAMFKNFHVNCEYNRMTDEHGVQIPKRIGLDPNPKDPSSVYPDIIVHRQEDGLHNLLIIEIKMSWKKSKKDRDCEKLKLYIDELHYNFGLYLEIGEKGIAKMQWF